MKVLLYDYCQLEERSAKQLKIWKGWHVTLFVVAAVCGILNFVFLHSASDLVDGHCVLYPGQLAFHMVSLPDLPPHQQHDTTTEPPTTERNGRTESTTTEATTEINIDTESNTAQVDRNNNGVKVKREVRTETEITMEEKNASFASGFVEKSAEETSVTRFFLKFSNGKILIYKYKKKNFSDRLMLDTTRTIFGKMNDCQFAEYMPLLSTVFAVVWTAIFIICPKGGLVQSSSSLQHPWRVLVPALVFSLALVGLTGHSFARTNGGLHAFCEAFHDHTNSTTCSSVDPFLERSMNTSWGLGGRAAAARAASAGAWASWACAAAVLLARCLAAPDFQLRRTGVYLNDPHKSMRVQPKSPASSRRNTLSLRSEPTYSTELFHQSDVHPQQHPPTPRHDTQAQSHPYTDTILE